MAASLKWYPEIAESKLSERRNKIMDVGYRWLMVISNFRGIVMAPSRLQPGFSACCRISFLFAFGNYKMSPFPSAFRYFPLHGNRVKDLLQRCWGLIVPCSDMGFTGKYFRIGTGNNPILYWDLRSGHFYVIYPGLANVLRYDRQGLPGYIPLIPLQGFSDLYER